MYHELLGTNCQSKLKLNKRLDHTTFTNYWGWRWDKSLLYSVSPTLDSHEERVGRNTLSVLLCCHVFVITR